MLNQEVVFCKLEACFANTCGVWRGNMHRSIQWKAVVLKYCL